MTRLSLFLCCASLLGAATASAQEGRLPVRLDTSPQANSPATKNLAITLPPGTYYLQAWSNPGSLLGGRAAGEIFQLTL